MAEGAKQDIQDHEHGYVNFIWLMKWGAVTSFVVGMIVVLIIAR